MINDIDNDKKNNNDIFIIHTLESYIVLFH